MAKIMIDLLITVFAVYGIIIFFVEVLTEIPWWTKQTEINNVKIIVFIKGSQNNIEGIMRDIVYRSVFRRGAMGNIYVVGREMDVETKNIIKKFENDYNFIRVLDTVEGVIELERV